MLHQFVVKVLLKDIDQTIENLNTAGIYYLQYETPIALTTTEYGYGFFEKHEKELELNIYAEEDESGLPDSYFQILQDILLVSRDKIHYSCIEEENWQLPFEDIDLGNGWLICSYDSLSGNDKRDHRIVFDPQGAFGTGLHGTTQDCLRIILDRDFSGQAVADLGTGSGILSVAALLKGATSVLAVDIEPVEREIQYNASLNHVGGIEVIQQDILNKETPLCLNEFDYLFINIGGEETLQLLDHHDMLKRYNGNYLISGLVKWSVEKVLEPLLKSNYIIEQQLQTDEWVTVLLKKG